MSRFPEKVGGSSSFPLSDEVSCNWLAVDELIWLENWRAFFGLIVFESSVIGLSVLKYGFKETGGGYIQSTVFV